MSGQTADQLYQVLEADGFFNEERFAQAFAGGKFRVNHWGRVRIRLELQRRAIAPHFIRQALESIDETEYRTVLTQLIEQKRRQNRSADPRQLRQKIAAAIIRAGFEPELVFQLI